MLPSVKRQPESSPVSCELPPWVARANPIRPATALGPVFDQLLGCRRWPRSPNYRQDGQWTPPKALVRYAQATCPILAPFHSARSVAIGCEPMATAA